MRNLRLLLDGAIYRLFVTITELAVICQDLERDYTTVPRSRARHEVGTLDAALRAIDFCHVTSLWQHIMSMRII